jgi:endonuclease-8
MTAREVALHPVIPELGPDVIADDFDAGEGLRRLRAQPDRDIATALLDQRTLSGIGNEIKNEALFLTRTWPWMKVAELDDEGLRRVMTGARDLLRRNRDGGPRRSRFVLDRRQLGWVQERRGLPCYECGTPIDAGYHQGEFRRSYFCPSCQRPPGSA